MSFNLQELQYTSTRVFSDIKKAHGVGLNASDLIIENNQQIINESKLTSSEQYHIFLSHSFKDANIIWGILKKLNRIGYRVYVDWVEDPAMDRSKVNKNTAESLRLRMNQSKSLFYATPVSAGESKWMPWELGYMDGKKGRATVLPIFETPESSSSHTFKGQEYLGVYPYVIEATQKNTSVNKLWVCESNDVYVVFDDWLNGSKPYKHE